MDAIPTTSLTDAKTAYWKQAQADGGDCPCCGRFGKVYRRVLTKSMCRALIEFYRHRKPMDRKYGGFVDYKKALEPSLRSDYAKLRHWGLVEAQANADPAVKDSGFWRITLMGKGFLKGYHKVQQYALLYDDALIKLEGPMVGPAECLKEPFDFSELMDDQIEPLLPGEEPQMTLPGAA